MRVGCFGNVLKILVENPQHNIRFIRSRRRHKVNIKLLPRKVRCESAELYHISITQIGISGGLL
jgi:hypothetical protein